MRLRHPQAEVFVPDATAIEDALKRTTHLAVVAHPDDSEIMAYEGVVQCFGQENRWFTSVVVTDGAGSARTGPYEKYSNEEMVAVRRAETRKAAVLGEYSATLMLQYPSAQVKDSSGRDVVEDLREIVRASRPETIYCHNLADKHDTHVAVAIRLITAIKELPAPLRPRRLLGCEVWRDLDWMMDRDKVLMDVSARANLATALVALFDSQIAGGKRYDLATIGRRQANATYWESHGVDVARYVNFAMDLTPLIQDVGEDPLSYVQSHIQRFADDVTARITKMLPK